MGVETLTSCLTVVQETVHTVAVASARGRFVSGGICS